MELSGAADDARASGRRSRASSALSRLTPYLTPHGAVRSGLRRTEYLCDRRILNTQRTSTAAAGVTANELENRSGVKATGVSNPSPFAKIS